MAMSMLRSTMICIGAGCAHARSRVRPTHAYHVVGGHHATADHLGEHMRLDDICIAGIGDGEKRPD